MKRGTVSVLMFLLFISCQHESGNRFLMGEKKAREYLFKSMSDSTHSFRSNDQFLISDQETAVALAEVLLFKTYGENKIKSERPYEIHRIDNYWFIKGTLERGSDGGTFVTILDAKDGRIMRMFHTR